MNRYEWTIIIGSLLIVALAAIFMVFFTPFRYRFVQPADFSECLEAKGKIQSVNKRLQTCTFKSEVYNKYY